MRALRRGAYPSVVKGRPGLLTPGVTDPLQNGEVDSRPPGPAWVARLAKPQSGAARAAAAETEAARAAREAAAAG